MVERVLSMHEVVGLIPTFSRVKCVTRLSNVFLTFLALLTNQVVSPFAVHVILISVNYFVQNKSIVCTTKSIILSSSFVHNKKLCTTKSL